MNCSICGNELKEVVIGDELQGMVCEFCNSEYNKDGKIYPAD